MSWIQKNHEKAILGGAAFAALALAWFGWSKFTQTSEDFSFSARGAGKGNSAAVADADRIPKAIQSLKLDHSWQQSSADGRPVDLFTGIPLFVHRDNPETPIDLVKGEPVHPPIPNTWWLENHLDPGFADSPQRDPDKDGFSNLEEFEAKTNPNDPDDVPSPLAKLRYVKDISLVWVLRPGYDDGNGGFTMRYIDGKRAANKIPQGGVVRPGDVFYADGVAANRFKLLGTERVKEMNEKIKLEQEITYLHIEDQVENKKGRIYKFPEGLSETMMKKFEQYDRDAVFVLEAMGNEGKQVTVKENTTFALPWEAAKKNFLLKEVTPASVTIVQTLADGSTKIFTIAKGEYPEESR